jgi:regulator of protease activity HflC (stomatin/prohibitin superfamily)
MRWLMGVLAVVVVLVLFVGFEGYVQVEDGSVTVIKRLGKYRESVLQPGPNWKIPILDSEYSFPTRIQTVEYTDSAKDRENTKLDFYDSSIKANDNRSLEVGVDVTVQFEVIPTRAYLVFRDMDDGNYFEKLNSIFRSGIRNAFSSYNAENIAGSRSVIGAKIRDILNSKLTENDYPFSVNSVQFRDFVLPESVTENVRRVQKASQKKEQLGIEREMAKEELEIEKTRLLKITAEKRQQTMGLTLLEKVDPRILAFQLAESALKRWDGRLPRVVVSGSSGGQGNPMDAISSTIGALLMERVPEEDPAIVESTQESFTSTSLESTVATSTTS